MKIAFRADASVEIGSGHVMRCLALADHLRERGTIIRFLCRPLPGNLGGPIRAHGHEWVPIEADTWQEDARACQAALRDQAPWDWIVVDHYGLDARWEEAMRAVARKLMVIDDLADRPHDCDLLLDQNLYPDMGTRYDGLVPSQCEKLLGPRYALLRPQFAQARVRLRERGGEVERILVCFGGSDPQGATLKALEAIRLLGRPDIAIDVVIGVANLHRHAIETACRGLSQARVHYDVEDMAALMASADLFVGSGGSIGWERCCLGLPGIVMACAANQEAIAQALARQGGHHYLGTSSCVTVRELAEAISDLISAPEERVRQSMVGRLLVDGLGVGRVAERVQQ